MKGPYLLAIALVAAIGGGAAVWAVESGALELEKPPLFEAEINAPDGKKRELEVHEPGEGDLLPKVTIE